MILKLVIWMIFLAFFHAKQEIEIEGKNGWARNLPTFRINNRLTRILIAKELTGYHIFMLLMFLLIFHLPLFFIRVSIQNECILLGLMSFYWVIEDFLFFIFNPHFGIKKFRKKYISWHKRFLFGIPYSYYSGLIIGGILIYLGIK